MRNGAIEKTLTHGILWLTAKSSAVMEGIGREVCVLHRLNMGFSTVDFQIQRLMKTLIVVIRYEVRQNEKKIHG